MNDLTSSQHFELHFKPSYFVHYEETNGSWRRDKWEELSTCRSVKRIQYNTKKFKNYIIIDIDNEDIYNFNTVGLPAPNFILHNRHKRGGHLFYVLNRTVSHSYYQKIWGQVQKHFSLKSGGDPLNRGFIGKNINNDLDFKMEIIEKTPYNLLELFEYIKYDVFEDISTPTTKIKISTKKTQLNLFEKNDTTLNRNVNIFNELRLFSYQMIKKSVNDRDFIEIVSNKAFELNNQYETPLNDKEVSNIVQSVSNYCLKNKSSIKNTKKRNIMKLNEDLDIKSKQKLGQQHTSNIRKSKTEMKIKIGIMEMKKQDLKINISTISQYTKLTRKTIRKYKDILDLTN